jgi:hypothetical protein
MSLVIASNSLHGRKETRGARAEAKAKAAPADFRVGDVV